MQNLKPMNSIMSNRLFSPAVTQIIPNRIKRGAGYPPVCGRVASNASGEGSLEKAALSARRPTSSVPVATLPDTKAYHTSQIASAPCQLAWHEPKFCKLETSLSTPRFASPQTIAALRSNRLGRCGVSSGWRASLKTHSPASKLAGVYR